MGFNLYVLSINMTDRDHKITILITVDDILSTILHADVQGQERFWKVAFDRFSILQMSEDVS